MGLRAGHHRHVMVLEPLAQLGGLGMQAIALGTAGLEVLDAGQAAGGDRRRQRSGEDETHGEGTHGIDDHLGRGDIAADHTDGLGHGALDDVHLVRHAQLGGDTGAARAVHAHRMHLVEVGEGVVALGDRDDLGDWGNVAVHRVDRLEHHDLRLALRVAGEDLLQMGDVVVAEDFALVWRGANAVDDRGVVQFIADHHAVGDAPQQTLEGGVVGAEAGGEDQRRFLAVPVGQARLQAGIQLVRAADIARTAGASAVGLQRVVHLLAHSGMLRHAEVVVAAPDHHRFLLAAIQLGQWVLAADAAEGGEGAVLVGRLQCLQLFPKKCLVHPFISLAS